MCTRERDSWKKEDIEVVSKSTLLSFLSDHIDQQGLNNKIKEQLNNLFSSLRVASMPLKCSIRLSIPKLQLLLISLRRLRMEHMIK